MSQIWFNYQRSGKRTITATVLDAFKVIEKDRFYIKFRCDGCNEIYSLTITVPIGQYEVICPKCAKMMKFELTGNPSSRINVFEERKITHHIGNIDKCDGET